jgi:hypothetical protein
MVTISPPKAVAYYRGLRLIGYLTGNPSTIA